MIELSMEQSDAIEESLAIMSAAVSGAIRHLDLNKEGQVAFGLSLAWQNLDNATRKIWGHTKGGQSK